MPAPSTCTVSGVLYGPDAVAVSGATVKVYVTTGFTDGSGNYIPSGILAQTETAADGTWSLDVIRTEGIARSVTFQFEYPLGNNQSRSVKYAAVVPDQSSANFSDLVNMSTGTAALTAAATTDALPEGSTNLYFTTVRAAAAAPVQSVNSQTGAVVLDTDDVAEATNLYYTNARADARIALQRGAANGLASLDSGGKVPLAQLPPSLMEYQGTWNASTNSPTLADGTGTSGYFYRVSVAGTQNLGSGALTFVVGDWVMYNGSVWQLSHGGADAVQSVNGLTGAVTFDHGDLGGLTDDDHTQYALLAGRSGGQTIKGDTASGGNLPLNSTNHATKGKVLFGTAAAVDEANSKAVIGGTTVNTGAILDVQGTSGGIGVPVLTDAQRNAITPARNGVLIWNSDNARYEYYNGGWAALAIPATPFSIANGGTGQSTATAAFDALAPTTTSGDIIYHNGTDNVRLAKGSDGQVLTLASGLPSWAAAGGGGSTYLRSWFAIWGGNSSGTSGCSGSPCTVGSQKDSDGNTDTISSITRTGTGDYVMNITSGRCSTVPACSFTQYRGCVGNDAGQYNNTTTPSATAVGFVTDRSAAVNGCGFIQCTCAK